MLNNHLIEVYNADSIHNGPIFDPQDHAQRPQNGCLRTCCGSGTATNPHKTWYHCTVVCLYHGVATDSLVEFLNVDQFCEVFQAVPLCHASANTFRPRAPPFWANTSGRGPTKQFTAGRQLGLVQIRIALQEGCVSIVVIHSQINKDKGNKQLIVAWIQFPFKSVLTGLPER